MPTPSNANTNIAFVAAACRPGSLEARVVHHCTCEPMLDRRHAVWHPALVDTWPGSISRNCPAHGHLLRSPDDSGVRQLGEPHTPVMHELRRRSLVVRVGYVVRAWLAGW